MLAQSYESQPSIGWLMSEKLDGVRAIWDGEKFISRNGNKFHAPAWFVADMPSTPIDGELFIGRGMFQKTVGIVRSSSGDWSQIKFHAFDLPTSKLPLEQRMESLANVVNGFANIVLVEQVKIENEEHLDAFFDGIISVGGEGVMIRKPNSFYECKRSKNLLKLKYGYSDEAQVESVGNNSVSVAWNGLKFKLASAFGITPKIGEQVTFSYFGLTDKGLPRHAVIDAVRNYE